MRFPTTVLALYLLSATNSHGDVVKTDLRSAPLAAEQFVFFCAEGPTSLGAVGFVHGDQGSGFQTDDWMVGGQNSAISARQNASNKVAVEACSKNALSNRAIMFVAELDSKVYSSAKDALAQFRTKGKVEITDLIVGLGQVIGVRLPTVLSKPFEYIRSLATLNPGRSVSAGEWLWQPPTIRMSTPPTPADAAPSSSPDKTSAVSPSSLELLPTGMADIKFVNRSALEHLFQALADAEDNSNVSYDIELHISDNIVHDTFVHPVQMRSDVTLEHGDSACVFANLDVAVPNLIELLNKVLVLPSTNAAALTRTFGFAGHSPLLGTSSDWQAAVTMPAGCYLTAVNAHGSRPAAGDRRNEICFNARARFSAIPRRLSFVQ